MELEIMIKKRHWSNLRSNPDNYRGDSVETTRNLSRNSMCPGQISNESLHQSLQVGRFTVTANLLGSSREKVFSQTTL
jgi:hypothetical protein